MKRSTKLAITATCLFLIVLIGGSIYVYNRMEHILSASSLQQLIDNDIQDKLTIMDSPKAIENSPNFTTTESGGEQRTNVTTFNANENTASQTDNTKNNQTQTDTQQSNATDQTNNSVFVYNPALNNQIASTLEKEVGRPVETSDMLKAGIILMNKLNNDEINFLFGFSNKDYTSEELNKLRELLLSKLSAQDVETLRALADKYGKNLYILDPNVPIK